MNWKRVTGLDGAAAVVLLLLGPVGMGPLAAGEAELIAEAAALHAGEPMTLEDARAIRLLLDRIVAEHPESDAAAAIVLRGQLGAIDVAQIDDRLRSARAARQADVLTLAAKAADPASAVAPPPPSPGAGGAAPDAKATLPAVPDADPAAGAPVAPPAEPLASGGAATEADEARLALDERGVRDVQARLLVLGFDPNGVDGRLGKGTRAAIADWQRAARQEPTGFLDEAQFSALARQSDPALSVWLENEDNRRQYEPPPPIPLTAANVSGGWTYTANCGAKSRLPGRKITGSMEIRVETDGGFGGAVRNSQGFIGKIRGKLEDRAISGRIDWGLLIGSVTFSGRIKPDSMTLVGRDSNGCNLVARKG